MLPDWALNTSSIKHSTLPSRPGNGSAAYWFPFIIINYYLLQCDNVTKGNLQQSCYFHINLNICRWLLVWWILRLLPLQLILIFRFMSRKQKVPSYLHPAWEFGNHKSTDIEKRFQFMHNRLHRSFYRCLAFLCKDFATWGIKLLSCCNGL